MAPEDPGGNLPIPNVALTPDGRAYAYTHVRTQSQLYLAQGID